MRAKITAKIVTKNLAKCVQYGSQKRSKIQKQKRRTNLSHIWNQNESQLLEFNMSQNGCQFGTQYWNQKQSQNGNQNWS